MNRRRAKFSHIDIFRECVERLSCVCVCASASGASRIINVSDHETIKQSLTQSSLIMMRCDFADRFFCFVMFCFWIGSGLFSAVNTERSRARHTIDWSWRKSKRKHKIESEIECNAHTHTYASIGDALRIWESSIGTACIAITIL